ncbi:MAG: hypothetical protein WCM76_01880 [Bacteroidota bacterium]
MKRSMNLFTKMFFVMAVCLLFVGKLSANNVSISNVTLVSDTIKFDISWDNSWRNTGTVNSTVNYDGVWVFIKYRDACDRTSSYPSAYNHVQLDSVVANHYTNGSGKQMGFSYVGSPLKRRAVGIYLYRPTDGTGTYTLTGLKLHWDQVAQGTVGGNWDIRVNAIEMVYIPGEYPIGSGTGGMNFRLGCGNPTVNSATSYNFCNNSTGLVPYIVTGENVTIPLNTTGGLWTYSYTSGTATMPTTCPKGYGAFWCMKYEISQQQYCDFLNSLDRQNQINNTYIGTGLGGSTGFNVITATTLSSTYKWAMYTTSVSSPYTAVQRQEIACPTTFAANMPVTFGCDMNNNGTYGEVDDGANTACNYLYYSNQVFLRNYLDWACLRPMSEMEYEKTCRGPIANVAYQTYEAVWGQDGSNGLYRNASTGISPGTGGRVNEIMTPAPNSGSGSSVWANNTGGPLRVGQTYMPGSSSPAPTRSNTGSSYYGVADMSGNVADFVWSYGNNPNYGNSQVSTWLNRVTDIGDGDVNTTPPTSWSVAPNCYRGGAWDLASGSWQYLQISYRYCDQGSNANAGGRGVRTVNY